MNQAPLLKTLYCLNSFEGTSSFKPVIDFLIDETSLEESVISQILSKISLPLDPLIQNQMSLLEKWRELLSLTLVLHTKKSLHPYLGIFKKCMRHLQRMTLWPEHQLFHAYYALMGLMLNQAIDTLPIIQQDNGACPLDVGNYKMPPQIPSPLLHAELGILWCLYGLLKDHPDHIQAALRLAEWQCNTLDHEGLSFVGLFSAEGEASERSLLLNNFLLFQSVARTTHRSDMGYLAEKQAEQLVELAKVQPLMISSFSLIIEDFFLKHDASWCSEKCLLEPIIHDPYYGLTGMRLPQSSAIATLYGSNSGMGCYHYKDIQVMSFGPQQLPLGDCSGFGLEGMVSTEGATRLVSSNLNGKMILEGTSRLSTCRLTDPALTFSTHPGWVENKQEFYEGSLKIEARFQGIFDQKPIIFSFFVKCKNCVVNGNRMIRPRSLKHYKGKATPVKFETLKSTVWLYSGQDHQEMHVIPLGGGDNFWGADFLIAYLLGDSSSLHSWELNPVDLFLNSKSEPLAVLKDV